MELSQFKTLRQRYKAHVERREHSSILRPGQMQVAQDMLEWLYEKNDDGTPHTNGYFVRPTGGGKTVSLIDFIIGINSSEKTGEQRWDKRVLVLTPTNVLNQQFAAEMGVQEFRNPDKDYAFNIPEHLIGVYDASVANKQERQEPLSKNIVVMTYDSFLRAVEEDRLDVKDFSAALLDEVHTRPRGDKTSHVIRERLFGEEVNDAGTTISRSTPPVLTIGATATHLYKSGYTIGDYLYEGSEPIHMTQINEAVDAREISGYRNVIVETSYNPQARFDGDEHLSEAARQSILKQEARDAAAIRILKHGCDPITGKAYSEMKSVWYGKDVDHAERMARRINDAMNAPEGEPYARAVSGRQGKKEFHGIVTNYKRGTASDPKALTNADILIHGFDDERAQLCFMTHPSGSPIEKLQMGGRVLRYHRNKPHATIFDFPDPQKDSPLFGELAGSYHSLVGNYEFPPTEGGNLKRPSEEHHWPAEISDLNAHYLTSDIERFASRRRAVQATDKKPDFMLLPDEMARKIGVSRDVVEKYIFKPLQGLYDQRSSRAKEIALPAGHNEEDNVYINGQRFGLGSPVNPGMGYFRTGSNEASFCINKEAAAACRFALFGKLPDAKPYMYNKESAKRVVQLTDSEMKLVSAQLEDAYHRRNNYQRSLEISRDDTSAPVRFQLDYDVGFCLTRNQPQLHFSTEGLRKLHQWAQGVNEDKAVEWWAEHKDGLHAVKSPHWMNKDEAMRELGLHRHHHSYKDFDTAWKNIERIHKETLKRHNDGAQIDDDTWLNCAYKRSSVMPASSKEFCLNHTHLDWLKTHVDVVDEVSSVPTRTKKGRY